MASIVVVDDDQVFLSTVGKLLTDAQHDVATHKDAEKAFTFIRRRQPSLVILAMRLGHPEGGWMILDRMRLDPTTAHIPVIICGAEQDFSETHAKQLQEEGSCVLNKPVAVDELLATVQTALDPGARACGHGLPSR